MCMCGVFVCMSMCMFVCVWVYLFMCVCVYVFACMCVCVSMLACVRGYNSVFVWDKTKAVGSKSRKVSTSSNTLFEQLSQNLVQLAVWSLGKGRMQKTSQMVVWQWKRKESLGLIITGCWLSKKLKEICNTEVLTWFQKL